MQFMYATICPVTSKLYLEHSSAGFTIKDLDLEYSNIQVYP
jgi:hypothetical protein